MIVNIDQPQPSSLTLERLAIAKVSSPFLRNRTEALFCPDEHFFPNVPSSKLLVLSIRAIGPNAKDTSNSDEALLSALQHINIEPELIQSINEADWPNHWLVHIPMDRHGFLPKYKGDSQGIFWNPKGNLKLFIWCVTPTSDDEFKEIYTSCEVLLEVKIPARGPMTQHLTKKVMEYQLAFETKGESYPMKVTKAILSGNRIGGRPLKNGAVVAFVEHLPKVEYVRKFLQTKSWKNANGSIESTLVSIKLANCCPVCGAESHEQSCPYENRVNDLLANMSSIRKAGPSRVENTSLLILDKGPDKRPSTSRTKPLDKPAKKQKPNKKNKPNKK